MPALKFPKHDISIGKGHPLTVIAGLNVLEDEALALTVGRHLKDVCARLELPYIFKASFDKANRSSITSYRGPGMEDGLAMLAKVKAELGVPICTDLHEPDQAEPGRGGGGSCANPGLPLPSDRSCRCDCKSDRGGRRSLAC